MSALVLVLCDVRACVRAFCKCSHTFAISNLMNYIYAHTNCIIRCRVRKLGVSWSVVCVCGTYYVCLMKNRVIKFVKLTFVIGLLKRLKSKISRSDLRPMLNKTWHRISNPYILCKLHTNAYTASQASSDNNDKKNTPPIDKE